MLYENPELEILKFEIKDVICASIVTPGTPEDSSDASGDWTA